MSGVLVVGYGPAAHRLVERLRHHGHHGPVTVLGAEPACHRPLLTSVLAGELPPEAAVLPPPPGDTRVLLGVRAVRVDRRARAVHTDDGGVHPYDTLVLATGARPDVPRLPGVPGEGVRTVRSPADVTGLGGGSGGGPGDGPVAVLGGGVLGVETAFALRRAGREVTLVHPGPHPMDRLLDARAGAVLTARLAECGVRLYSGRHAAEYTPGKLTLADGRMAEADTLLLCTGVVPDTRLARQAGLPVRRGVVVDDRLRTGDPRVHAIGDCAEYAGQVPGLLSCAWEQAETLARLLAGQRVRHRPARTVVRLRAPGTDLAVLGPPGAPGDESVTLSDPARGRYASLTLDGGRIAGGVLLGLPRAIAAVSQLHDRDQPVPAGRLALLLGSAAPEPGRVELPDDTVLCFCNNVTRGALAAAWHEGARDLPALAAATRATTGCGTCADDVRRLCETLPTAAR
ncbi:FAD-dependent oxidoreductase [Streptomyces sp. TRM 70361]|uniref:FAD-dependent oxidoreductase n=1 Tax=Streptomyces sp. TRM 70361 TaxID=3116553 RepID=UPI002E7B4732|nr:FAD-dependent oxidoreductase [Streptomyces sp. TRM 70361]MEE1940137.1 FAD-dependent oxidoreductase [Streptomyces sp. TRM 70361]